MIANILTIIFLLKLKCTIFDEALRICVKRFKQKLRENYLKSTEIAITACKFSKIFREGMPPDPPRVFHPSKSASSYFYRKNTLAKNAEIMAHPFQNFSQRYRLKAFATRCSENQSQKDISMTNMSVVAHVQEFLWHSIQYVMP